MCTLCLLRKFIVYFPPGPSFQAVWPIAFARAFTSSPTNPFKTRAWIVRQVACTAAPHLPSSVTTSALAYLASESVVTGFRVDFLGRAFQQPFYLLWATSVSLTTFLPLCPGFLEVALGWQSSRAQPIQLFNFPGFCPVQASTTSRNHQRSTAGHDLQALPREWPGFKVHPQHTLMNELQVRFF